MKAKKCMSIVLSAAVVSSAFVGVSADNTPDNSPVLFSACFSSDGAMVEKGKLEAFGNITYEPTDDGNYAARFDGSSAYFNLTKEDGTPLLKGEDEITVSMRTKNETHNINSWFFYAAPNSGVPNGRYRIYTGMYYDGGNTINYERWVYNDGNDSEKIKTQGSADWQNIDVVIARDHTDLYINNKLIGTREYSGRELQTILGDSDEQIFYVGRSAWNDRELFQGLIDSVSVYSFAPSIELGDLSAVTEDIQLTQSGGEGYTITWESSDPSVITDNGTVTRQEETTEVTLTATISYGDRALEREYIATVLGTLSYNIAGGDNVTLNKTAASPGEKITASVTVPEDKVLVDMQVNGSSFFENMTGSNTFEFTMPSEDVMVTAEFEDKQKLLSFTMDDKNESGIGYFGDSGITIGQKNNAVDFTGGYAALDSFPLRDSFTFSAWINPSELGTWERLFDFGSNESNYIFLTLNQGNGAPRLAVKHDGGNEEIVYGTRLLERNSWSYVTVTLENKTAKIYINGREAGTGSINSRMYGLRNSEKNYIGKSQYPRDPVYRGAVDEIAIYNYALTAEEVKTEMMNTMQAIKSVENPNLTFGVSSAVILPDRVNVIFENGITSCASVTWSESEIPDGSVEGDYTVHGTADIYGTEIGITANVRIISASKDPNYSVGTAINFVKNTGIEYADALYNITAKETAGEDDLTITVGAYDDQGTLIGGELSKTLTSEEVRSLGGKTAGVRLPLKAYGRVTVKSALKRNGDVIAECEREIVSASDYADSSQIKLKNGSRLDESERVGLGYIMGIDLPRLVAPSYEVHGLTLTYEADDEAVKNGDKKAGDRVKRYGGWEALGAWKANNVPHNTLAGQQMGHWLSSAAVFYNDLKNNEAIALPAASLNGNDTSDTAPAEKGDITVTPRNIHDKMEYVIDKLDELQNTDIPTGWTATVNKEYIGGCDEIPFINCFAGNGSWLGKYWVPWYNIHKVYQGLLDVYDYAEPELAFKAYGVLKKLSDWAAAGTAGLSDTQMQSVLNIEYGGINEIFARMYEITGDELYKNTSRRFTHDSIIDPLKTNNTASLSGKHANTQIPKFVGAAELYEQDTAAYADYRTACENFWRNVNYERCYAIGGNSLGEYFQPVGTEELGVKSCESCNTYNMMRLTEHLFSWEHRSEYMDWYERALYNHVLGQQEPETGAKMYFVSMVQGTHRIYEQKYNAWWCCTGTGMENPGRYTRVTYFEDNDDLYVNLYMPGTYTWAGKGMTFNVETNYPYEETVKITVTGGDKTGNVKLRAPGWLSDQNKQMTAAVNNERKAVSDGGEYITLNGIKNGDVIELTIPMGVSLYKSRDNVKVAYEYGPMVLAAKLNGTIKPSYEYIWEERNTACQQVAYPVLRTSDGKGIKTTDDITEYVSKTGGSGTLKFTLAADKNSTGRDVELVPFIDITHNYHNIYFDIDTAIDDYGINLSNVQLDYVDPDGQQSELGHGMIQSTEETTEFRSHSVQGADNNGQYRYAFGEGGFFKYNMLVDKNAEKNYLIIRYFDTDSTVTCGSKTYDVKFKIFAGDTELVIDGNDYMEVKDGKGGFANKLIEIPREAVLGSTQTDASTGLNIISIRLAAYDEESCTVPYRRMYTTTDDPENMGGNQSERTLPETVEITSSPSRLLYTSEYGENADCDMYVALYDKDGVLLEVKMNESAGEFIITEDEKYTVKVFFWTDMKTKYDPIVQEIQ
ncbi:MAG: beta-L-arabinofuranosidase domain-containing protein [Candidatus Ornithomonoglobus sp.]